MLDSVINYANANQDIMTLAVTVLSVAILSAVITVIIKDV